MNDMTLESMEEANQVASDNVNAPHFKNEEAPNIVPNEAKQVEPTWKYAENIPGIGEKPEWFLQDKYSNVSQQAAAYLDLQKKLGEFAGTPKDGYSLEKYKDVLDIENPFIHKILETSKSMNMSQSGLDEMLNLFVDYEKANTTDTEAFIKSLTPQEVEMAKNVHNWLQNNFAEEEIELLEDFFTSSKEGLNLLSKFRGMSRENRIPTSNQNTSVHTPTLKDIESLIINNYEQYKKEPAYRERIERQRAEIIARGN